VELTAQAGEPWDSLVAHTADQGLSGLECLSGIPGFVGATPIQNVGAYGQDVSETIARVRVLDRRTLGISELSHGQCGFGYRSSIFKTRDPERYVVLAVTYRLTPGGAPKIAYADLERALRERGIETPALPDVRSTVLAIRRSKSMVLDASDPNGKSCGSFFLNPLIPSSALEAVQARAPGETLPHWPGADGMVKLPAAWLIERAGFRKGQRSGTAGISSQHSLALVNCEGDRARDVVDLARRIRARVNERFGVRLVPEPAFWGFSSLDEGLPDDRLA
jgi:UDP-N-acetylmuramate dehydrogenase